MRGNSGQGAYESCCPPGFFLSGKRCGVNARIPPPPKFPFCLFYSSLPPPSSPKSLLLSSYLPFPWFLLILFLQTVLSPPVAPSLLVSRSFPSSIPQRRQRQAPTGVTRAGSGWELSTHPGAERSRGFTAARVEVAGCLLRSKKVVSSPRTVSLPPRHLPSSTTPLGTEPGGQQ